jgi:hypothetical protein
MYSQEIAALREWCAAGCPSDTRSLIAESWTEAQETRAPYFRDVENKCPACQLSNLFLTLTLACVLCNSRTYV